LCEKLLLKADILGTTVTGLSVVVVVADAGNEPEIKNPLNDYFCINALIVETETAVKYVLHHIQTI